jgi:primosomal protein DnaI
MYVFGPPRTGKSFSLATFAYKFALNEVGTIGVIEAPSLSQRLLDLSNNEPTVFAREIDQLKRLDILIIDRLGDESVLDKSRDQVWIPLLQDRLHQQKATMIISSFSLEDLLTLYTVFPNQKPKAKQFIELIKTFEYQLFIPPATPL